MICDAINAPLAAIRFCLLHITGWPRTGTEIILETALYLALVWLVWYAAIIEMEGSGESVLLGKLRFRGAADILAVTFGSGLLVTAFAISLHDISLPVPPVNRLYSILLSIPYLLWGGGIIVYYGRDLQKWWAGSQRSASAAHKP